MPRQVRLDAPGILHIHLLFRSGSSGLPKYMHRLLTGYAITYNRLPSPDSFIEKG